MSRCGWCGADVDYRGRCPYTCEEVCVCESAVGDCHADGPCPVAEEFDRRTCADIAAYGLHRLEEGQVRESAYGSAVGG